MHKGILLIGLVLLLCGGAPAPGKKQHEIRNNSPISRRAAVSTVTNIYRAISNLKGDEKFKSDIQNALIVVQDVIKSDIETFEDLTDVINWQKEEIHKFDLQAAALASRINIQNKFIDECGKEKEVREALQGK